MVQPLLIPAKDYPPTGSATAPIDVDNVNHYSPINVDADEPFGPGQDWALDIDCHHSPPSSPARSDSLDSGDGPIAHAQLRFAIHVDHETPPLCHTDGTLMEHHKVWERRDAPAASPNHTPPLDCSDIVPAGFVQNEGSGAIKFPITDSNGVIHQPDYIQIVWTYDPFVLAIVRSSPYLYGQALHIEPRLMTTHHPRYDPSDLDIFKMYHQE